MSRLVLTAFAAAIACGAAPSFAQGSGADPDRHTPQVAPAPAQPAAPAQPRAQDRREQQGQRDANRQPRQPQEQAPPRNGGQRGDNERRHADGRHGGDDRRHGDQRDQRGHNRGYVVARPSYIYTPPPVYYSGPSVYYGGAPAYYPYNGFSGYTGSVGYNGYAGAPVMFQAGDYLPPEFRQQQYVVLDWQWRGLAAPPYGYQWMLIGPDNYALVLASTGQIVSVVAAR